MGLALNSEERRVFSAGLSLDARIRSVVGQWTGLKKANTDSGLGWALGPSCLLPKKGIVFFGVLFYGYFLQLFGAATARTNLCLA